MRSPANVVKYRGRDHATHVLLARYPVAGTPASLNLLNAKAALGQAVGAWDANPGPAQRLAVTAALATLRAAREAAEEAPNPAFAAQAKAFMDAGYQVTAVPDMPWGAGGLHCQTLH